jgi:hypothetical protein
MLFSTDYQLPQPYGNSENFVCCQNTVSGIEQHIAFANRPSDIDTDIHLIPLITK